MSDYCDVNPVFGTLADFDALVARAHALGLKVLLDQVWAHTSDQHPWFKDSRSSRTGAHADWYVWRDAKADEPGIGWPSWAFENHDAPRAISRWCAPEHASALRG